LRKGLAVSEKGLAVFRKVPAIPENSCSFRGTEAVVD